MSIIVMMRTLSLLTKAIRLGTQPSLMGPTASGLSDMLLMMVLMSTRLLCSINVTSLFGSSNSIGNAFEAFGLDNNRS